MDLHPTAFKVGADVFSSDGHKLGELHRAVVRRTDLALTHVVVDIGFQRAGHHLWEGGLGLDYDRIVPVEAVAGASDKRVDLSMTAAQFKETPEYTAESFEGPHDVTPGEFDISDIAATAEQWNNALIGPATWIVEKLNKPLDSADIAEGTSVWRQTPHEKLGVVKRLLLNEETGRLKALVVESGSLFLKHDVILPVRYISELLDDFVHVEISDPELEALHKFEG